MVFYIIVILSSLFFFDKAHKSYDINRAISVVYFFLYVIILGLIGGLRDLTVGRDLSIYGIEIFEQTKRMPTVSHVIKNTSNEYGFYLFNWICSRIGDDIHIVLWVEESMKAFTIGWVALQLRKKLSATLLVCAYLFFMYVDGFNIMRQTLAMSFFIIGIYYLVSHKPIIFAVMCFIAFFFHSSGILGLIILLPYMLRKLNLNMFFTFVLLFLAYYMYYKVMSFLEIYEIFGEGRVELYLDRVGKASVAKGNILLIGTMIVIMLFIRRNIKFDSQVEAKYHYFFSNAIVNIFFLLMASKLEIAFRISWYQTIYLFVVFLNLSNCAENVRYKGILYMMFLSSLFIHFFANGMHGFGECLPYTSSILGI